MTDRTIITLSLLALGGCAQVHPSDEIAPGIYRLRIERELDACSPARPVGDMGSVVVLVDRGAIDAPVPDAELTALATPRVRLGPENDFHAETNRRIEGRDGAFVHEEWTMLDASAGGFALSHSQGWEGLEGCGAFALEGTPAADCESERRLGYELAESCRAPCALRLTAASTIECACP